MVLFIASVALALVVSGLCSLLEATLLSLTPSQVAGIAEKSPRTGAVWQRFKSDIHRPIAVILIINTASHTIGATVAGSQFEKILDPRYTVAFSVVFTFLMLQLSEMRSAAHREDAALLGLPGPARSVTAPFAR